jgi:hypothetical protein
VPFVFSASLQRGADLVDLFSDARDPQAKLGDRPWGERRFPLDGRAATLVLRIAAPAAASDDADLVGWTVPRVEPATG